MGGQTRQARASLIGVLVRAARVGVFVVLAVFPGAAVWFACHGGWAKTAPNSSDSGLWQPIVEYREMQSGTRGQTGRLLTINKSGEAVVQEIPLGPGPSCRNKKLLPA